MAKVISKTELIKELNKVEALEIILETIDRHESTSSKQSKVSKFQSTVQKQIKDERDVILISIKVK
jgi:hypothetical protein